jgi:hypothetical protein
MWKYALFVEEQFRKASDNYDSLQEEGARIDEMENGEPEIAILMSVETLKSLVQALPIYHPLVPKIKAQWDVLVNRPWIVKLVFQDGVSPSIKQRAGSEEGALSIASHYVKTYAQIKGVFITTPDGNRMVINRNGEYVTTIPAHLIGKEDSGAEMG